MTPPKAGSGAGSCLPLMVVVALGEPSVPVTCWATIPAVLRDHGVDPAELLAEAGISPSLFDDSDNMIPFVSLGRLVTLCVARTGCSHFGLLVGQQGGPASLGLVGFLVQHSPDVATALRTLVRYLHLHDRGAVPTLVINGNAALFGYAIYQPAVEAAEQIADGAIAVAFNIMRRLCGPGWQASEVLFAHREPPDIGPFPGQVAALADAEAPEDLAEQVVGTSELAGNRLPAPAAQDEVLLQTVRAAAVAPALARCAAAFRSSELQMALAGNEDVLGGMPAGNLAATPGAELDAFSRSRRSELLPNVVVIHAVGARRGRRDQSC
jgi:hypothetical protein